MGIRPLWRERSTLETRSGVFGPQTDHAVREFQRAHGLAPVDGEVGSDTREALAQAARRPLVPETTQSNNVRYEAIRGRLPECTDPKVVANVALQARENGITGPDHLRGVAVRGSDLHRQGPYPGARLTVDMQAPTPDLQAMSDHMREQTQQQRVQDEQQRREQSQAHRPWSRSVPSAVVRLSGPSRRTARSSYSGLRPFQCCLRDPLPGARRQASGPPAPMGRDRRRLYLGCAFLSTPATSGVLCGGGAFMPVRTDIPGRF